MLVGRQRHGSSGEGSHIRHAWDHTKSVRQNLAEMGLAMDPNKAVPLRKRKVKAMEVDREERPRDLVRKPYVVNVVSLYSPGCPGTHSVDQTGLEFRNPPASASQVAGIKGMHHHRLAKLRLSNHQDLEAEASLPEKKGNTLSRDLIDYVQYMVENHGEDYKAMARDEKNYYQDTPKQIRNKINVYKRFYPTEWQAFIDSLQNKKMEVD
ncbi:Nucleolar protein 16 [Apodemus speciosus]|uniref:Nucleolar protein 16 n=1 Tax=Apodemus speciosus TaxID=105296 RepID=A0ABQ0FG63_APOSI